MADGDPPALTLKELALLLAKAPWADIDNALRKLCFRLLEREDDDAADDLISEAKATLWTGHAAGEGRRWDPRRSPDLKRHLAWVVRHIFLDGTRTPYERDRVHFEEGREPVALEPTGDPDRVLRARGRMGGLQERIERTRPTLDPLALAAFEEVIAETFEPEVFAPKHGISIKEANEARRRAKYRWDATKPAGPDSSGSMRAATGAGEDQPFEGEPES